VVEKTDSTLLRKAASAGKITHEPLLVEKITLHFQFEFNSIDLDTETEEFLEQLSVTLHENEKLKVKITGHTDNIGPEKFNQKLSLKRAETIRTYLMKKGIDTQRLHAEGKGMSNPIGDNDTEENRAKNRRVEMLVYLDY
jgi:outer membrane protein OmpA-like peptidoglycan-associated protein